MELTVAPARLLAVAAAVGLALAAVGCGGDPSGATGDQPKPAGRTMPGAPAKTGAPNPK